jgi:hypothetical protein
VLGRAVRSIGGACFEGPSVSATNPNKQRFVTTTRRGALYVVAWAFALTTLSIGAACSSSPRDNETLTSEMRAAFGTPESGAPSQRSDDAWSILLGVFPGPTGPADAQAAAGEYARFAGLPGAYVVPRDSGAAVQYGHYATATGREAQRDLAKIRQLEVGGSRPFALAFLVPLTDVDLGAAPEVALSRVKPEFGNWALYTLQVAVYESDSREEAKRLAERAALQLRREGELAFYHHGRNKSMVTIGVFGTTDFDLNTGRMSQEITDLRERHPYNLYNGMGIRETDVRGQRLQPSALVAIPDP